MTGKKKTAQASIEAMYRVFTVPEAPESTLSRIDQNISRNLAGFLQEHIVAVERDLADVEKNFSDYAIPEKPVVLSKQAQFPARQTGCQLPFLLDSPAFYRAMDLHGFPNF